MHPFRDFFCFACIKAEHIFYLHWPGFEFLRYVWEPEAGGTAHWFDDDPEALWVKFGQIESIGALESWLFGVRPCSRFGHLP